MSSVEVMRFDLDQRRERRDRQERDLLRRQVRRHDRPRELQLRAGRRLAGRPLAGQVRPERDRRLGVERDVELAQLLVAVEVSIDAVERHLLLGLVEVDAEEALGGVEAQAIDALRSGGRLLRQRRRGRAGGKKGREEASSVHMVADSVSDTLAMMADWHRGR